MENIAHKEANDTPAENQSEDLSKKLQEIEEIYAERDYRLWKYCTQLDESLECNDTSTKDLVKDWEDYKAANNISFTKSKLDD